ncbi:hypothetical protein [Rhizobium leguminosarum]|uniref:hypothetical protein n=1 Tax=Rhizobium leguminosarum TaxID=384 RepID=UPI0018AD5AD3|nr:hypothetical protein [Rhizobium leguminosarum]WFT84350.1 hypothetical protein QA638_15585 [Rhizobium leguminosarum]
MTFRHIESQLAEELFVQGGYLLELTNRTFFEFFQHEAGIEAPAYLLDGGD